MQTKAASPMTSFLCDTLFSISKTHIGKQLPFIFICQSVPIIIDTVKFSKYNSYLLNKIKGDEVIKKLHSLLTKST
jgi:hypothetical protein